VCFGCDDAKIKRFLVAEKMIEINPEVTFIFLTARKMKEDKLKGLKLCVYDYIVKPFEADELVLRFNNILKRTQKISVALTSEETIKIGNYKFNTKRLELHIHNSSQRLTEKEGALIQFL
jgi:DNA-binding response OmpR family regulator